MKKLLLSAGAALHLLPASHSQTLFDSSRVHVVQIHSLYDGLNDTLERDYIFSFDFLQHQIRDIPYTICTVSLDGTQLDTIGIRQKGFNSWWSSPKKPMKLDLNRVKKGQHYQGLKKLNLHNRASDPSALRENLCYELLRRMGIPTPRTAFAPVYLDDQYLGLYRLVEEVDNVFLDAHFGNHQGNLYKQNAAGSAGYTLDWLGSAQENYYPQYQLENHESENDWSALVHFIDVLNHTPEAAFADAIAAVFDVPSFLRVLALDLAVNNLDFYANSGRNYYLYHDAGGDGKFHWLPWDYNLSWRAYPPPLEPDVPNAPVLVRRLLSVPQFRQQFLEQYCVLRQFFDAGQLFPRIESDSALIRPWLLIDSSGDYTVADFEESIAAQWFSYPGLKPFLVEQSAAMDHFLQDQHVDCSTVLDAPSPGNAGSDALLLMPNPAPETVVLRWPEAFVVEEKYLSVLDVSGKRVHSQAIPAGVGEKQLDLRHLPPGLYLIHLTAGGRQLSARLVVARP
ncbi:MAG: CotH kinase family protein [Saprospiraceae bacterium]|nr:CotH kinase family protein [Saprospiraceae bacterium]